MGRGRLEKDETPPEGRASSRGDGQNFAFSDTSALRSAPGV